MDQRQNLIELGFDFTRNHYSGEFAHKYLQEIYINKIMRTNYKIEITLVGEDREVERILEELDETLYRISEREEVRALYQSKS